MSDKRCIKELPSITIFKGQETFFGKRMEQTIEVNPNNLHPFEREGSYGHCMSCDTELRKGDWYEIVGRGRRYWCCDCVDDILVGTAE